MSQIHLGYTIGFIADYLQKLDSAWVYNANPNKPDYHIYTLYYTLILREDQGCVISKWLKIGLLMIRHDKNKTFVS